MIGFWEVLFLIVIVVLLLFVPSKLPEIMRNLGKAIKEFRKAMKEVPEPTKEIESISQETLHEFRQALTPEETSKTNRGEFRRQENRQTEG